MRAEIVILALIVGFCTWAFRFFPTRADLSAMPQGGPLSRFLAATGPAAIATLFTASALPYLQGEMPVPLILGTGAVLVVFAASRSVVGATMAGSAAYALGVWLI
ncbi:MAG: AzlD domain-containing protein [Brevundimonas sp.]|uniref:AzlD domain-containing protein n=1 Tax=Brevundimonas sp. TaxID=1871086 RepID=UPI002732AC5A|nr:AzlD domain-containing protein [Brevundimonas sp.]MDP3378796.1 AzlD domain-containing protein [Brevundimonas sp.]